MNTVRSVHIHHARDLAHGELTTTTWEHSVSGGAGNPFALPGDSGSLICSGSFNTAIGILIGADTSLNISHFTPLLDIFADIKTVTGAEDVRLC